MNDAKLRITDISTEDLKREMTQYGLQKASSKRSSRKFLRSIGLKFDSKGVVLG